MLRGYSSPTLACSRRDTPSKRAWISRRKQHQNKVNTANTQHHAHNLAPALLNTPQSIYRNLATRLHRPSRPKQQISPAPRTTRPSPPHLHHAIRAPQNRAPIPGRPDPPHQPNPHRGAPETRPAPAAAALIRQHPGRPARTNRAPGRRLRGARARGAESQHQHQWHRRCVECARRRVRRRRRHGGR